MTDAPTSEMASGRKTKVLASDSRRMRSKSPAKMSPSTTLPAGPDQQPDDVVAQDLDERGLEASPQLASVKSPASSWKLRMTVPTAGYTRKTASSTTAGADEDPRQDPVAPLWLAAGSTSAPTP